MGVLSSTGLRAAMLVGPGAKGALDGGAFHIYGGAAPASADDGLGNATLLCVVNNMGSGITLDSSATGVLTNPPAETWAGDNIGSGVATFFRLVAPGDGGSASVSAPRIQGSVGVIGADLNLDTVALVAGLPTEIRSYTIAVLGGA